VQAIADRFDGEIRLGAAVRRIERHGTGAERRVDVVTRHGRDTFDRVIVAAHSDQALRMLADPSTTEREVLGGVRYQPNRATLHTDVSLLPPRRRAWAAWNYDRRAGTQDTAAVTYDMTTLQRLPGRERYLVSLNSDEHIDPDRVVASFDYAHPFFDHGAVSAQARFDDIDGVDHVHYCGAWWGHGFHEDGMASGLRVCARLGVHWPVPGFSRVPGFPAVETAPASVLAGVPA
jgi:predicted NAD/FAD-binding protein